jgi:branched-chain amino acid transport system permease protein
MSDGMVKEYIPTWGAQWTNSVIFGILVIIMIFRPSGLLGEHTPEKV